MTLSSAIGAFLLSFVIFWASSPHANEMDPATRAWLDTWSGDFYNQVRQDIRNNRTDSLREFIVQGADVAMVGVAEPFRLLPWAARYGNREAVSLLLSQGAQPGPSELNSALFQNNTDIIKLILSKPMNMEESPDYLLLTLSLYSNNAQFVTIVEYLLKQGVNPSLRSEHHYLPWIIVYGCTSTDESVNCLTSKSYLKLTQYMLKQLDDINERMSVTKSSVLDRIVKMPENETTLLLMKQALELGADPNSTHEKLLYSPLRIAWIDNNAGFAKLLLQHGAAFEDKALNAHSITKTIDEDPRFIELLIQYGEQVVLEDQAISLADFTQALITDHQR